MALAPLQDWKDGLAALPKVADASWSLTFATYVGAQALLIEPDPAVLTVSPPFTFVFNVPLFAAQLASLAPSMSALAGAIGFANAWQTAILTTVFPATLNVLPGSSIAPTPSPTTIFSVVTAVALDPASVALGYAKILELAATTPVGDPNDSLFPEKLREAFALLTITVTGLDSTPPPAGPLPLIAASVPLI